MLLHHALTPIISTHAPTKGATLCSALYNAFDGISTHAPTKGATSRWERRPRKAAFQPTLPQRERQPSPPALGPALYFNPRSHKGSDELTLSSAPLCMPFQPTLPQRERQVLEINERVANTISTHAPTKGATVICFQSFTYKAISTHAPTKGATQIIFWPVPCQIFQPTLPQRERRCPA